MAAAASVTDYGPPSDRTAWAGYVGRVGALAVALGVGWAVASPAAVAWAETDASADAGAGTAHENGDPADGATGHGRAGQVGESGTTQVAGDISGSAAAAGSGPDASSTTQNATDDGVTVAVGDSPAVVIDAQTNG